MYLEIRFNIENINKRVKLIIVTILLIEKSWAGFELIINKLIKFERRFVDKRNEFDHLKFNKYLIENSIIK